MAQESIKWRRYRRLTDVDGSSVPINMAKGILVGLLIELCRLVIGWVVLLPAAFHLLIMAEEYSGVFDAILFTLIVSATFHMIWSVIALFVHLIFRFSRASLFATSLGPIITIAAYTVFVLLEELASDLYLLLEPRLLGLFLGVTLAGVAYAFVGFRLSAWLVRRLLIYRPKEQ